MYKIEKEPAYQLYQFTSFLYHNKNDDFFKSYDNQAIYRSIINRTYYSSYSMTEAWLFNNHGISINGPEYYKSIGEDIVSVHVQIRVHLEDLNKKDISSKLYRLKEFRVKADYSLYPNLNEDDLEQAIELMECIVNELKDMDET